VSARLAHNKIIKGGCPRPSSFLLSSSHYMVDKDYDPLKRLLPAQLSVIHVILFQIDFKCLTSFFDFEPKDLSTEGDNSH
jgi:hypothetical protein